MNKCKCKHLQGHSQVWSWLRTGPFGPYKLFHLTLRGGRRVMGALTVKPRSKMDAGWDCVLRPLIIARERKPVTLQEVCLVSCFLYFPPFPCGLRIAKAALLWHYIQRSQMCVCVDLLWFAAVGRCLVKIECSLRCLNIIIHSFVLSAL